MNAQELKSSARLFGADLVGIADIANLEWLPPQDNPRSIFPQAKRVIVIGRKILRGTLRGIEEGTELSNSFTQFGFTHLEDNFLAKTTYDLCIWMEARSFEAVPLFAYDCAGQAVGVPVAAGKPAPNVILNYRLMAQAAGLGETGLNGLFLTPEYGPRQRFAMLLTDADLEADAPFAPRLCDDCGACLQACPLQALDRADAEAFGLPGRQRPVASRQNKLCLQCRNGAQQTNEGRFNTVDRIAAACGRACVAALDARGIGRQKFPSPFRTSQPWGIGLTGDKIQ